jgi:class 3 adenylate cyclase
VIEDQCIVWADLRGFSRLMDTAALTLVERVLDALYESTTRVCRAFAGTVRFSAGDAYCLTFEDVSRAMTAAETLREQWEALGREDRAWCALNVAIHRGTLYAFRSYFYGRAVDLAAGLPHASSAVLAPDEGGIFLTGVVRRHLVGTPWDARVEPLDTGVLAARYAEIGVYRLAKREP